MYVLDRVLKNVVIRANASFRVLNLALPLFHDVGGRADDGKGLGLLLEHSGLKRGC